MEKKNRKFRQVSAEFRKLEKPGDSAEGVLQAVQDSPVGTGDKTRPTLILRTDEGRLLKVPVSESTRADLVGVTAGEYIRVTFAGSAATARGLNPVKLYRIEVEEA